MQSTITQFLRDNMTGDPLSGSGAITDVIAIPITERSTIGKSLGGINSAFDRLEKLMAPPPSRRAVATHGAVGPEPRTPRKRVAHGGAGGNSNGLLATIAGALAGSAISAMVTGYQMLNSGKDAALKSALSSGQAIVTSAVSTAMRAAHAGANVASSISDSTMKGLGYAWSSLSSSAMEVARAGISSIASLGDAAKASTIESPDAVPPAPNLPPDTTVSSTHSIEGFWGRAVEIVRKWMLGLFAVTEDILGFGGDKGGSGGPGSPSAPSGPAAPGTTNADGSARVLPPGTHLNPANPEGLPDADVSPAGAYDPKSTAAGGGVAHRLPGADDGYKSVTSLPLSYGGTEDRTVSNDRLATSRAPLLAELDRDPQLRHEVLKTISMENAGSAEKLQTVLESMVNRAQMYGYKSLRQAVHSGFYGPVNRGEEGGASGPISAKNLREGEEALKAVRGGSNIINYRTDQGMLTDSGARRYFAQGGDRSGWKVVRGENFFYMGEKGRAWAQDQEDADKAAGETNTTTKFIPGVAASTVQLPSFSDPNTPRAGMDDLTPKREDNTAKREPAKPVDGTLQIVPDDTTAKRAPEPPPAMTTGGSVSSGTSLLDSDPSKSGFGRGITPNDPDVKPSSTKSAPKPGVEYQKPDEEKKLPPVDNSDEDMVHRRKRLAPRHVHDAGVGLLVIGSGAYA